VDPLGAQAPPEPEDDDPVAKLEKTLLGLLLPHSGQAISPSLSSSARRNSNLWPQLKHRYSYTGIILSVLHPLFYHMLHTRKHGCSQLIRFL
jgi:hypothetical protein